MTKTQTKLFASKVQSAITKQFSKFYKASHEELMDFYNVFSNEGQVFHADASFLIIKNGNYELWAVLHGQALGIVVTTQDVLGVEGFRYENEIIKNLDLALNFNFCRNYSRSIGCETIEMVETYFKYIKKHISVSRYEMDKCIYTYFVNKTMEQFPHLIIKPIEKKPSRPIILPDYKDRI